MTSKKLMLLLMNKSCLAKLKFCDIILVNTVVLTVHFDRQYCNQARNQGGETPKNFLAPPGKMCWT